MMTLNKSLTVLSIAMTIAVATIQIETSQASITKQTSSHLTAFPTTSLIGKVAVNSNLMGNFQAAEHPTQGRVKIVTQGNRRYIEFDQNFKTDQGPDLFVILHRADAPPISGIKEKDYLKLAKLQKIEGQQRYALPANINLSNYRSIAIWCRKFNATFGYAPLVR